MKRPQVVSFPFSVKDEETNAYVSTTKYGIVMSWLVVPDETRQYGEPGTTFYNPSAIVRCDDGRFYTIRVDELRHNDLLDLPKPTEETT